MTLTFQVLTKSNDSRRLMYEICSSVLRQKLKFERMKELKSFVVGENVKEFEQNLADCLWLLDLETFSSVAETDEGLRKRFVQFVKGVLSQSLASRKVLESTLEVQVLEEAGMVKSKKDFFRQMVAVNTRMFLVQPCYFLLSEASEGYSKLICELSLDKSFTVEKFQSIIGQFSLELSRCVDLCISVLEKSLSHAVYDVLASVPTTLLLHVLDLKLKRTYGNNKGSSIWKIIHKLIRRNTVSLEMLYGSLQPCDEEGEKFYETQKARISKAEMNIRKTASEDNKKEAEQPGPIDAECLKSLDANQKFLLCKECLRSSDWINAELLLKKLVNQGLSVNVDVLQDLCYFVERMIEPVYRRESVCGPIVSKRVNKQLEMPVIYQITTFEEIPTKLIPVLNILQANVGLDTMLYTKLCRLFVGWMNESSSQSETKNILEHLMV